MSQSVLQIPDFHAKQLLFFNSTATEILYGGDTRGGKSAAVKLSLIRWCSMIPGLQCDIFRLREDDVIGGYMEGEFGFPMLLQQWIRDKLVTHNQTEIKFWNGSLISLEHCWTDASMSKIQGIPKHVRVIDEAGQIPEKRLKWLKLWMTMSNEAKEKIPEQWRDSFPKIIYLTNRIGTSKGHLKRVFVRSRPKYAIEKVGAFFQQYIPANVNDNPSENIQDTIDRINEGADATLAKALLSEDGWDAQTGNYFENWNEDRHVVKDFIIPDFWLRARFFDYGSYEPWACVWMAVSPGVSIHEGTIHERYLPRGCKVIYREWYGCKAEHPTENPKDLLCTNLAPANWSNVDIANGITERTESRFDSQPIFTDKFPFIKLGGRAISDDFKKAGIKLTQGELDRKNRGAMTLSNLVGTKLIAGNDEHWPMMIVFESCKYCREYMPLIERHPTPGREWDYQENGEATHIVDCITMANVSHDIVYDAPTTLTEKEITANMNHPKNNRKTVRDILPDLDM